MTVVAAVLILVSLATLGGLQAVSLSLALVLTLVTAVQFYSSVIPTVYVRMETKLVKEEFHIPLGKGDEGRVLPVLPPKSEENVRGYLKKKTGEIESVLQDSSGASDYLGRQVITIAPGYLDMHIGNGGPGVARRIQWSIMLREEGIEDSGYRVKVTYEGILGHRFIMFDDVFDFDSEGRLL